MPSIDLRALPEVKTASPDLNLRDPVAVGAISLARADRKSQVR